MFFCVNYFLSLPDVVVCYAFVPTCKNSEKNKIHFVLHAELQLKFAVYTNDVLSRVICMYICIHKLFKLFL